MAELAAVNDLFQVRVKAFLHGQEVNNVLHFKAITADGDVELHLIQVLIECFMTHLIPGLSSAITLDTIVWKRVSPTLGPDFITTFPPLAAGTLIGDSLPSFCAALLSIRTAQGGRSKRGRMFLAGLPETASTQSNIGTGTPTWAAILAFAACLVDKFIDNPELGTGRYALGIYSRLIGGSAFPYGAGGFTPAVSVNAVNLVATMRSRKVGRGS